MRDFNSQADDYDLSPSGRSVVFSIHGEIFTTPVDEGDLRQITESPARDKEPRYSPDGKWIAFISDLSGREEIYTVAVAGGEPQKITDLDALKFGFSWSPSSKELAFISSDNKLRKYSLDSHQTAELAASKYGNIGTPVWSPDGKWIAYSKADLTRNSDIYLIPSAGGEEHKMTFDSFNELNPRFSPDGRKLFFVRNEGGGFGGADGERSTQIYSIMLEHQDHDPGDPEERAEAATDATADQAGDGTARRPAAQRNQPPKDVNIDWAGLKRRTRQVTRMPFAVFNYAIAPDNRTIVFVTTEPASTRSIPVIYSIQDDGRRLTRIAAGTAPEAGEENAPQGRFGGGGGISELHFSRDGRALFFREGRSIYTMAMPNAAAAGAGLAAAAAAAGLEQVEVRQVGVESTSMPGSRSTSQPNGPRCSTTHGAR